MVLGFVGLEVLGVAMVDLAVVLSGLVVVSQVASTVWVRLAESAVFGRLAVIGRAVREVRQVAFVGLAVFVEAALEVFGARDAVL